MDSIFKKIFLYYKKSYYTISLTYKIYYITSIIVNTVQGLLHLYIFKNDKTIMKVEYKFVSLHNELRNKN